MIVAGAIIMIQKKHVTNKAFLCPCNLQYNNLLKTWQYLCILRKPFIPPQLFFLGETKRGKKKKKNCTSWELNCKLLKIELENYCKYFKTSLLQDIPSSPLLHERICLGMLSSIHICKSSKPLYCHAVVKRIIP